MAATAALEALPGWDADVPTLRSVWVVAPTFNEAPNLEWFVDAVSAALRKSAAADHRILVVDDGSPDGTGALADRLSRERRDVQVLHRTGKQGLGRAYLAGFEIALREGASHLVEMDVDGSHDPADLVRLLDAAAAGAGLVLGSRYVRGGRVRDWGLGRRLLSRSGCWYARRVLDLPVRDLTGGFKCIRRDVLLDVDPSTVKSRGYAFQVELTARAVARGHAVREVPITFRERRAGASKMNARIALEAAYLVPRLRRQQPAPAPGPAPDALRILVATRGVVPVGPTSGGAELVAWQLAAAHASLGHQVTFLADVSGPAPATPNLTVLPVGSRLVRIAASGPGSFPVWVAQHLFGNLAVARKVVRLAREGDYDLIHAHGSLSAILIKRATSVPLVYTEHDAPPWHCRYRRWPERALRTLLYRALNVRAFRSADRVGATFQALGDEIADRWGVPRDRVLWIQNGADVDLFHPEATRRRRLEAVESATEGLRHRERRRYRFERYCVFVGRLTPRKAPDLLVRAVAASDDINCVFVGDGPMRPQLERLARDLGASDRVAFLGSMAPSDISRICADAELLVLPSVSETTPLVIMEAMACGTPVLATRIAGVPSIVEDWQTGFLVTPGDLGELTVSLRFLMRDDELRQAMGDRARERAQERCSWPTVAGAYHDLYRSVVLRPRFARPEPAEPAYAEARA